MTTFHDAGEAWRSPMICRTDDPYGLWSVLRDLPPVSVNAVVVMRSMNRLLGPFNVNFPLHGVIAYDSMDAVIATALHLREPYAVFVAGVELLSRRRDLPDDVLTTQCRVLVGEGIELEFVRGEEWPCRRGRTWA